MDPFTILCSTCQSRIRIRNPEMIGQLANCPKCNSMIMIALPDASVEAAPQAQKDGIPVDSAAMTKEAIAGNLPRQSESETQVASDDLANAGFSHNVDFSDTDGPDEYRLAAPDMQSTNFASPNLAVPADPLATGVAMPGGRDAAMNSEDGWNRSPTPLLPSDQWTSSGATKTRQYLLVGFLGLSGIVLAVVGFFAFLNWYSGPVQPAPPPLADANNPNATSEIDGLDATGGENKDRSDPPEPMRDDDVEPTPGLDGFAANTPDSEPNDSLPTGTGGSVAGETDNSPELPETGNQQSPSAGGDLTGAESVGQGGLLDSGMTGGDGSGVAAAQQDLPQKLREFGELLTYNIQPTLPEQPELSKEPPVTAEDLGLSLESLVQPAPPIDWQERSQVIMPGVILGDPKGEQQLSFAEAVNAWSTLSGVPVMVDLSSFLAADMDPNPAVRLPPARGKTIGQLTKALAAAAGGEATARENRYVAIQAPASRIESKLPSAISLDGLGDDFATWLLNALEDFYPDLPRDTWQINDETLSYDEQKVERLRWFEIVRMLENLRTARGLPGSLSDYAPERLRLTMLDPASFPALDRNVSLVSPQSRPVSQVLPLVCSEAGLVCWLDWANLDDVGLAPPTTAVVVTHGRPLRRVLANYAHDFPFVIAIENESSLWLTSPKAYRAQTQLYVLPSEGRSIEQWQQALRLLTPSDRDGVGPIQVVLTPDGNHIVVRCCRPKLD